MKNNKILPDAVTYGYYNKVVYESHWPSAGHSPEMLWMKVQHVMRGVYLFKQAGQARRERRLAKSDQTEENGNPAPADGNPSSYQTPNEIIISNFSNF